LLTTRLLPPPSASTAWTTASPPEPVEALGLISSLADRFRVEIYPPAAAGGLVCAATLLASPPDLSHLLSARAGELATTSFPATAASLMSGYSIRVASAIVASWVLHARVHDVRPDAVWLRWHAGRPDTAYLSPVPAWCLESDDAAKAAGAAPTGEGELLDALIATLLDQHLLPVAEALRTHGRVSKRSLHGAIASPLGNAFAWLDQLRAAPTAHIAQRASHFFDACGGRLGSSGRMIEGALGEHRQLFWCRDTCCLAYLRPGVGYCGTCNLLPWDERVAAWERTLQQTLANAQLG